MPAATLLLIALGATTAGFLVVYGLAWKLKNFGIVDVAWSAGFAPVAIFYAAGGAGYAPRRILIAALASGWSLRLGVYLGRRVGRHHPAEDRRYTQLRQDWAGALPLKMGLFFVAQAVLLCALSVAFLFPSEDPHPGLRPIEIAAAALWLIAVVGEAVSDAQLAAFKASGGGLCDRGLWRYSRHPNYFFEWLVWVAFALFALPAPFGWIALACPAVMLHLLLNVTGIRYTEEQLLLSKGDSYRLYRERTNAFVPWPPS